MSTINHSKVLYKLDNEGEEGSKKTQNPVNVVYDWSLKGANELVEVVVECQNGCKK